MEDMKASCKPFRPSQASKHTIDDQFMAPQKQARAQIWPTFTGLSRVSSQYTLLFSR
jgi:hypothetical protein